MQAKKNEIIYLLVNNELAISKLYKTYARNFPSYGDFWSTLADEEIDHAKCLSKLEAKVLDGTISFDPDRFSAAAINRSLRYIEELLEEAADPDFSLINALSGASLIEDSLLENKFFEVFRGDSPKLKQVFKTLIEATQEHRQRVHEALSRETQRGKTAE